MRFAERQIAVLLRGAEEICPAGRAIVERPGAFIRRKIEQGFALAQDVFFDFWREIERRRENARQGARSSRATELKPLLPCRRLCGGLFFSGLFRRFLANEAKTVRLTDYGVAGKAQIQRDDAGAVCGPHVFEAFGPFLVPACPAPRDTCAKSVDRAVDCRSVPEMAGLLLKKLGDLLPGAVFRDVNANRALDWNGWGAKIHLDKLSGMMVPH